MAETLYDPGGAYHPDPSYWTEPPVPLPGPAADPAAFCPPLDQPVCTAPGPLDPISEGGEWVDPNGECVAPEPAPAPQPVIPPPPTEPCPPGYNWSRKGAETTWTCVPGRGPDPTVGMPTTTPEEDAQRALEAKCMQEFADGKSTVSGYGNCVEGMGPSPRPTRDPNYWGSSDGNFRVR